MFDKILCLEYQSHLLAVVCDCCRDVFTHHFVHVQHVQVNPEIENWRNFIQSISHTPAQLQYVGVAERLASAHVGLENAPQLFHRLVVFQHVHVSARL